jgi:DNA ligase-1
MVAEDKEGLMLNLNVPYQRKRHRGLLKIKRFYTMDLPITGYEEGTGRLEGTLGSLVLDFCGNEVKVGTGFSDEERRKMWGNRDKLVGVLCEVKYKEISSDKSTGTKSLQFPVFVQLRNDKTEVSYG